MPAGPGGTTATDGGADGAGGRVAAGTGAGAGDGTDAGTDAGTDTGAGDGAGGPYDRGDVGAAGAVGRGAGPGSLSAVPDSGAVADLARTVAAGEAWPVIGVWWGPDGAGFTVAAGFRRPVGFAWLADGTPAGPPEAAGALIARLGLDPVLDGAALDELTGVGRTTLAPGAPDPEGPTAPDAPSALESSSAPEDPSAATGPAGQETPSAGEAPATPDASRPGGGPAGAGRPEHSAAVQQRLVGLLAIVSRAGLRLPDQVAPGAPEHRLRAALAAAPGAQTLVWRGWRDAVRAELDRLENGPHGSWVRGPRARAVGAAQLALGLSLAAWALRRDRPGWALVGALLATDGALAIGYDGWRGRRER
ncbi:hypothetical protein AAHZ94_29950 [Streptomyces sp. HSW2009]|uniref:hypothetical protein n=1 Tax=Streptomyces sp. HSW2009 TaxID=3142890 RepID=UPI0032ED76F4